MKLGLLRSKVAVAAVAVVSVVAAAAPASAAPRSAAPGAAGTLHGATAVTTAPGIVTTLLGRGVLPLPILPQTGFRLGLRGGLTATYTFPITGGDPSLSGPSGDIFHSGGIYFTSVRGAHLSIRRFDIDLAAGKVFATRVDGAPAHVAILDLDLAGLRVSAHGHTTVLSGIKVTLDAQAAAALDATFANLNLPAGLAFGSATVTLRD